MTVVSLLTDFGLKDGTVGVMKGVIWGIAPQAKIVDISHQIQSQNIHEGSLILFRSAPYFPPGTIHVVVIDPGVGTARRPIAGRVGEHYFVGPDNGVITMWLDRAEDLGHKTRFIHLDRPEYWLPEVSHVFHGRDIFAPVGAHLAAGVPLENLGTLIDDIIRFPLPKPKRTPDGWSGEVVHIDHFGNITTNIRVEHLTGEKIATVGLGGVNINGMVTTFGQRQPGELVALLGSTGNLIVCKVNGNAAVHLNARIGDPVVAKFASAQTKY